MLVEDQLWRWSWRRLIKIHAVDFLKLLLKPDIKRVLRGGYALDELLWMIRLGVHDHQISLGRVLEVGSLDGYTQAAA